MNWFVPHWRGFLSILLVGITLVACNNPEADRLREENAQLKSQLKTISQERDALKAQVENVRAALGQASSSTTPDGATSSDSGSSATPPSSPSSSGGSTTPSIPDSGNSPSSPQVSPAVLSYGQEVLKLAGAYRAQTGTPPTDCTRGYEAGADKLVLGEGISLKTCAVETVNDQLRVSLETTDGAKLSLPSNGP